MNPDNDTTIPPTEWLAAVRETAKRRFGDKHGQPVDERIDDRQQPQPAICTQLRLTVDLEAT